LRTIPGTTGLDIEINDRPFPDDMFDQVVVLVALVVLAYGAFALLRDALRWARARKAPAGPP
jgi:hypothetical protein